MNKYEVFQKYLNPYTKYLYYIHNTDTYAQEIEFLKKLTNIIQIIGSTHQSKYEKQTRDTLNITHD